MGLGLSSGNGGVGLSGGAGGGGASVGRSQIRVNTTSGQGSTNTMIRHFVNTTESEGTDITFASNTTSGASFTIVNAGHYSISYSDSMGTEGRRSGISLNSNQLTTDFPSITLAHRLAFDSSQGGVESYWCASWTGFLDAGDVIRPHLGFAASAAVPGESLMTVARIS